MSIRGFALRRLARFAFAAALVSAAATAGAQPAAIDTTAPFAIVMDAATGTVLFEKNADSLMAPASMAKLMTAEVVFNEIASGRLSLDQEFPISVFAWRTGGAPSGTSTMFAQLNSRVKVRDLLRGAIIISANDGCIALAEGIAGNEPAFAQRMTRRARELGLTRSRFTNSTGLPDPDLRVTPRELALLAAHIQRTYPQFFPWYSEREFQWNVRRPQQNRNPLLRDFPGADGMKTGYTDDSGYGLVGTAIRNDQRLIVVVNGLDTERERSAEARKLLEWGFRSFDSRLLFTREDTIGEASVYGGIQSRVPLIAREDVRVLVPRESNPRELRARVRYDGPIRAPITQGQEIARLQVFNGQTLALERPLLAAFDVAEGTLYQRAFDAAWELTVGLVRSGFGSLTASRGGGTTPAPAPSAGAQPAAPAGRGS
jgi:D-alanyl-D-alanine carboxypeptidase (penicillin-binding protein 5/6)